MTYDEGIKYMERLSLGVTTLHSKTIKTDYDCLYIKYPGYKESGDYQVNYNNHPPTHQEVCMMLYNLVRNSKNIYSQLFDLLSDLYRNGTNILGKYSLGNIDADFLITLIFWMTLQDEINFPQPRFQGRRMPFSRYFEAIYCAAFDDAPYTIENVMQRCNNRGTVPQPYDLENAPSFYFM